MILIARDGYDRVRVFDGPDMKFGDLDRSIRISHHIALDYYFKKNPKPSHHEDQKAWLEAAPQMPTVPEWLLANGYTEIKFREIPY